MSEIVKNSILLDLMLIFNVSYKDNFFPSTYFNETIIYSIYIFSNPNEVLSTCEYYINISSVVSEMRANKQTNQNNAKNFLFFCTFLQCTDTPDYIFLL